MLHVGWGFTPWRRGGLIQYAEDLMSYQAQQGYRVSYFFAGRKFPYFRIPKIKRFSIGQISCYEIINSLIIHGGDRGTLRPDLDLSEPITEEFFRNILADIKPDLIHIHELAGLPSSLIDIAKQEFDIPIIMTLADYYLLCPTLKLFTHENSDCGLENIDVGETCVQCCRWAPKDNRFHILSTLTYRFFGTWLHRHFPKDLVVRIFKSGRKPSNSETSITSETDRSEQYQKRRTLNVKRLKNIDLLIPRAEKVSEIYRKYTGETVNVETINPTLLHIDNIVFSRILQPEKIKFVTLNGLSSVPKGGQLVIDAVKKLNNRGLKKRFEVHVYGHINPLFAEQGDAHENLFLWGTYNKEHINDVLDGMHVGILPSVWQEVYGYVGVEMLAKGLPLIVNDVGGVSEYAKKGVNCIINISKTADELADHMLELIERPEVIIQYNENIFRAERYSFADHFKKIEHAYQTVMERE